MATCTKSLLSHEDYTVGWICALPLEMAAAKLTLDAIHPSLSQPSTDQNTYTFGNVGGHNVVIACLPGGSYGNVSAAIVATQLLSTFHSIRFGLMVGIGGGVPSKKVDIRLGDIVVSQPTETSGGVVQYDLGKALTGGQFQRTGILNRPPEILLTTLATLQAHHLTEDSRVLEFAVDALAKMKPHKAKSFTRPTQEDCLYQAEYEHATSDTCAHCDRSKLVPRQPRDHEEPIIHYGLIASANQVVKDAKRRDHLAQDLGVYCVEMEAAGLMNGFPSLVIRGICDYSDSHKNKEWQGYAAAMAAAYAKELLLLVPINQIDSTPTARDTLAESVDRFTVPLDLSAVPVIDNFIGRQEEQDCLWQYLQPTDFPYRRIAILHGLGGIGKTQLASHFAREHKHDFTAIFWISGKDRSTLLQSLSSIFSRLPGKRQDNTAIDDEEVEQRARSVIRWLALDRNSRWLIIFDNVDQYLPISGTRDDVYNIGDLTELGKSFPIYKLDSTDAIQLLLRKSSLSAITDKNLEDSPDTLALASRLDGLPLAIVIAAAFIRQTGTSITEYLQHYQESWSELQSQSSPGRQYQQGNMLQTWMISYREIQKRNVDAAELLLLFAHFDNRDIWYKLVKGSDYSSNVPTWLKRTISSGLAFKIAVKSLIEFSLLETKLQEGSYTMHPVVQDWCLHIARTDEKVNSIQLCELALISVGCSVPSASDRDYSELQRRLLPHADFVRRRELSGKDVSVWGAICGLGDLYSNQGKLKETEEMYQRALTGFGKALGPDHTFTLNAMNNLGNIYKVQGKLTETKEMYQRALVGFEKRFGEDHMLTLNTVNNLGILYKDQGKLKEAEEMYQRALAGREKALGPDHISTLETINNLGAFYSDQGKLKETEEMYQRALIGFEKALGPDHMLTLSTFNNLGALYRAQGKLKEAEKRLQQALEGREKVLGLDHISTLSTLNNLGGLYSDQGKLKEAEEMYQRALAGREKALGPDHTSTLETINHLGNLYKNQRKLKEAEEMYQRALAGREKALGPDHTSTLETINNLGNLYKNQRKLKEAEEMYQRALAGREKALGPDHISTLETVNNLGNLYSDQGKLKEAEEMYQQALAGREKALGPDHTSTLSTMNSLGVVYFDQGKLKKAEEMFQRILVGKEKALGPAHISTLETVNNLSAIYSGQGKLKQAEKMLQRALTGFGKALGPDHISTLNTMNNLGILYKDQGKLKEAEEMYQRAMIGLEKALGPDHPSTLNIVNNLGSLYSDQGKLKQAKKMLQRALTGFGKALRPDHIFTLETINNLGILYKDQGKHKEAEERLQRALAGREKALGPDHASTLETVNNLGILYSDQGKLKEAEEMYQRALAGREQALGPDHTSTLTTVNNLGNLYKNQRKLKEAEEMYQRALAGREKALGPDHISTLETVNNLGNLYSDQGKLKEAEEMCQGELPTVRKSQIPILKREGGAMEKSKDGLDNTKETTA
ncbi:hypothetical protein N7493_008746 [Penicillium malachiteum]|uniref:Nucleoside phosphorylase domain-containing protein n=1 Tax=Penicillium malachiteum TaxID=1324776 RepID=A0AAD6MSS9_9EURO|nr:hypothetical protein N7493_008746 [Penicillium malachiteum]